MFLLTLFWLSFFPARQFPPFHPLDGSWRIASSQFFCPKEDPEFYLLFDSKNVTRYMIANEGFDLIVLSEALYTIDDSRIIMTTLYTDREPKTEVYSLHWYDDDHLLLADQTDSLFLVRKEE